MGCDRSLPGLLAGALLLGAACGAGAAEPPAARVVLVLDASGSMWGQVEGEPKIAIARRVIRDLIDGWDPNVHLGLTAYGHRREGDCADIETLIPPGEVNPGQVIGAVEGINPKGKTPLSDAVIHAARELGYEESKATVILVSDGIETCDRDPCLVARELEAAGADFTVHVIGFDVAEEDVLVQLRCLAENTGGDFTAARDAGSLKLALDRAVRRVRIYLRAPEVVFGGVGFEVDWAGPDEPGDQIVIVPKGAPEGSLGGAVATGGGSPARLTGPPTSGPHEVRYVSGADGSTLLSLEITARGAEATLEAPARVDAGGELEVAWTGPAAAGDLIALVPAAEPDERYFTGKYSAATSAGSPARLRVFAEPGEYELRYLVTRGARVLARRAITVDPVSVSVEAPATVEAGAEFEVRWSGPGRQGDRLALVAAGTREGTYSTKRDFTQPVSAGSPLRLTAYSEPGAYEVRYMAGADGTTFGRAPLTITPSRARVEAPARVAPGAEFEVRWSGPSAAGDRIVLVPTGAAEGTYFTSGAYARPTSGGSPVTLRALPDPGSYEVRYLAEGDGKTLARAPVEIASP